MITIDARNLLPPEPFEKVVEALRTLTAGEMITVIMEREPVPLFRFLNRNDYQYESSWPEPGRCEIRIWEKTEGDAGSS
ncbi:MAG: DUF2249 domain-containing protein [Burkholderiaceae bacterium]